MYVKMLMRNIGALVNMPLCELETLLRELNDNEREEVIREAIAYVHEQRRERGELMTACARGEIERFPREFVKIKREGKRHYITDLCTRRSTKYEETEDLRHALAHAEELRRFQRLFTEMGSQTNTVAINGLCAVRSLKPRVSKHVTIYVFE